MHEDSDILEFYAISYSKISETGGFSFINVDSVYLTLDSLKNSKISCITVERLCSFLLKVCRDPWFCF